MNAWWPCGTPILLGEDAKGLAVVSHVGRPDEQIDRLGRSEALLIVQGHHGYISPSWDAPAVTPIPTWNFSVAHCHGVPEILDENENLNVLVRLTETFRAPRRSAVGAGPR